MKLSRRMLLKLGLAAPFVPTQLVASTEELVRAPYVSPGYNVTMINWEPYAVSERFIGSAIVEAVSPWNPVTKSYHVILRNQGFSATTPLMGTNGKFVEHTQDAMQYRDEDLADFRVEGIYDNPGQHPSDLGYKNWHNVIMDQRRGLL